MTINRETSPTKASSCPINKNDVFGRHFYPVFQTEGWIRSNQAVSSQRREGAGGECEGIQGKHMHDQYLTAGTYNLAVGDIQLLFF